MSNVKTERDNLSEQNFELSAFNNTYKEKLLAVEQLKNDVAVSRETASSFTDKMAAKTAELSDRKEEKVALQKELDDLREELEARKIQVD